MVTWSKPNSEISACYRLIMFKARKSPYRLTSYIIPYSTFRRKGQNTRVKTNLDTDCFSWAVPSPKQATFMAPSIITPFIWGEDYVGHSNVMKSDRRELQHVKCLPWSSCLCGKGAQHTALLALASLQGCPRRSVRRQTHSPFPKIAWSNSLHLPWYPVECHSKGHHFLRQLQRAVLNNTKALISPLLCAQWDQTVDWIINLSSTCGWFYSSFIKGKCANRLTSPCSPKQHPCSSFQAHSSWD